MQINLCAKVAWTRRFYSPQLIKVMKLTVFLIILACLQVSAKVYSQISLSEKNTPLATVISVIQDQSGYSFFYKHKLVENINISAELHNVTLQQALDKILDGQPLTYEVINKTVVIKEKDVSFLDNLKNKIKSELAQVTVKGQVTDETGQPMAGVNVREKGTQNGTTTDSKGTFTLAVSSKDALVDFSYIGYETKELTVTELPIGVTIRLVASTTNLHEVVVDKGYYVERQELSTGAVSIVANKTITDQPVAEPMQTLEGQVPGLYIRQSSGFPGSYENILVRGVNSIANGNSPLIVIDGVPFGSVSLTPNMGPGGGPLGGATGGGALSDIHLAGGMSPFNTINPSDIESIEVLKDADATALYGSRGANGVILITTRKGRAGNTLVNFDLKQGVSKVGHFMDLMNTPQYLQMRHEAFALDGLPFPSITSDPTDQNYDVNGGWDTTRYTNWQKQLIGGTAQYSDAQLSISGGSENTQFLVNSGFTRQTTVFPGDFADGKGSVNFNLTHSSVDKHFRMQLSAGYTYDHNSLPQFDFTSTALTLAPDAPALYNANGTLNWQPIGGASSWSNPLAPLLATTTALTNGLTSHGLLAYDILPGLTLQTNLGYTDQRLSQVTLVPDASQGPPDNTVSTNRTGYYGNSESTNWIIEPGLTYNRKAGKGKLNVYLGSEFDQSNSSSNGTRGKGYANDALISNPTNAATTQNLGYSTSLFRYNAVRARIGYTWEDKYLLNLTGSRDGSSRFGSSKQWGNFGSVGAGWIFSKETFVSDNASWLSFGKLRASYGITGSDQIGDYLYLSSYSSNSSTYQGNTGLSPSRIPNPYFGWEVDKKFDGGIELGFLKNRINVSVDYYDNRSGNQLVGYALPYTTGFSSVEYNLPAVVQNSGVEVTINTINIQSKDFKWTTAFNFTVASNKLLSYPGLATSSYAYYYTIGLPITSGKSLIAAGVNPADGLYQFKSAAGGITENPQLPADLASIPSTLPKFDGGIGNSFSFKGLQLDVFIQFRKQLGYNYASTQADGFGQFNFNLPTSVIGNTWQKPGDNTVYGRLSTFNNADPNYYLSGFTSNFGLEDASFIRLKNVVLSYSLPKTWIQNLKMQNLRLFLQGENLLTLTHYQGLDPENALSGSTGLPTLRTIVFGIHASF